MRDSSEKEVGWFVASLGLPFLYLSDAKATTLCGSPLLKKKTTTRSGQFRESTD